MENTNAKPLCLLALEGRLAVCQVDRRATVAVPREARFFSVTRTPEELSVVCDEEHAPEAFEVEVGWRAIKVDGPLAFATTGVISSLTGPLAEANIPVFSLSTFDTDYLLVKEAKLEEARGVLTEAGHHFVVPPLVRPIKADDEDLMREMLTVAAHADDEEEVVHDPEISRYIDGWGQDGDLGCVVEDASGEAVGAAWVRLFPLEDPGYGFVSEDIPELAIGVRAGERGSGFGRALVERIIEEARGRYPAISLSVRRDNDPAAKLYRRLGFMVVEGNEKANRAGGESIVMKLDLR
ncbi:GNAT family N-acetyltransferase [Rubrobacter indicoceani]|uniref:GNAT family N-acetyltransferase n=1 Tax=Rubrobacter indicoceani TaxID=2051957 RepID=UPI001968D25C|nr:GNAT family N-acetyltransferase [Rubrobacter indicoceani]